MSKKKKRPRGRPSKGADGRTIPVMVKVSKRELSQFKKKAKADGMALGPWLIDKRRKELEK